MTSTREPGGAERKPRLGQRVRFTAQHDRLTTGSTGMIDQVIGEKFVVLLDEGAWFFWTTFAKWQPTGEPDVELSDDYRAARREERVLTALPNHSSGTVAAADRVLRAHGVVP